MLYFQVKQHLIRRWISATKHCSNSTLWRAELRCGDVSKVSNAKQRFFIPQQKDMFSAGNQWRCAVNINELTEQHKTKPRSSKGFTSWYSQGCWCLLACEGGSAAWAMVADLSLAPEVQCWPRVWCSAALVAEVHLVPLSVVPFSTTTVGAI